MSHKSKSQMRTRVTKAYRDGWDRIYGKTVEKPADERKEPEQEARR